MLFCTKCKQSFDGSDSGVYQEAALADPLPLEKTRCPSCRVIGKITWKPKTFKKIDAKFDYFFQCFRKANGDPFTIKPDTWDFSCPKCHGPSKEVGVDTYNEYYVCLDCEHSFIVN